MDFQPFHITVKALIVHKGKLILMKSDEDDRPFDLDPPGGRVNQGELVFDTLKRELEEEIGLDLDNTKHTISLFEVNQRDLKEYDWVDGKSTIFEIYYLITILSGEELKVYAKEESEGLVFIDIDSDLDKYTYTAKGRKEIYKRAQKILNS